MQIRYENKILNTVMLSELRTGDIFLWGENAWMVTDHKEQSAIVTDDYLCVKMCTGLLERFCCDDLVLPRPKSLLTVTE